MLPAHCTRRLNGWIAGAEGKASLSNLEMTGEGGSPDDLDAFIAAEIAKWGPIIEKAGIKGINASNWWGVATPAGTPSAIVERLAVRLMVAMCYRLGDRAVDELINELEAMQQA